MTPPKKLTVEERAKTLLSDLCLGFNSGIANHTEASDLAMCIKAFRSAIAEAREEALNEEKCKDCGCSYERCCCNPVRELEAYEKGFSEAREASKELLSKYLTHHHHSFRDGITLCESGYGAPDAQCVISLVAALRPSPKPKAEEGA